MAAPGRINIIGEHTDYAGGLCLPAAVDRYVAVAVGRADSVEIVSDAYPEPAQANVERLVPGGGWADLGFGVIAGLKRAGILDGGLRVAAAGSVPAGSGLSSSAAFGVALASAALAATTMSQSAHGVASLCQQAEREFLGVPSGLMDQTASLLGRAGHALLFDPDLDEVTYVAVPPEAAWLVCDSGMSRELRGSGYAARPAEAMEALRLARAIVPGLDRLGDLSPPEVEELRLPEPLNRRARHVAGEVLRVKLAVAALEAGNLVALGQLLVTSHRSLARDCEVSIPELDQLVDLAMTSGCLGARLMGAGFGGSVLALVISADAEAVAKRIARRYRAPAGTSAAVYRVEIVDGVMAPPA